MTIAITGHRPNKLGFDYDLKSSLIDNIRQKIENILDKHNPDKIISGMALGIDTLFAIIAVNRNIPLIAAIPCKNQDKVWPDKSKMLYKSLLNKAQDIVYVSEEYSPSAMQKRNEWMVDNCDLLIAVWDGSKGGTFNCVKYAEYKEKDIIYINPNDLK